MKLTRKILRKLIIETINKSEELESFKSNLQVFDAIKDKEVHGQTDKEIIVKIKIENGNTETAANASRSYAKERGYDWARGNNEYFDDPVNPKIGYFKFMKIK